MNQVLPFVVPPTDYPRPLNVIGMQITVLASNAATQGYEITLQKGNEGTGAPPHSHAWDESFYIIAGTVEFSYADQTLIGCPGTLVHLPAGTAHSFRFGAGGGEMLEFTGQGGSASQMFASIDREIPPGPPDLPRLVKVLERNGVRLAA